MKLGAVQTFPPSSRLAVLLSPSHVPWMSRGHLRPHWTFSLPLQTDFFSIVTCPVEWCHHPPTAQATGSLVDSGGQPIRGQARRCSGGDAEVHRNMRITLAEVWEGFLEEEAFRELFGPTESSNILSTLTYIL